MSAVVLVERRRAKLQAELRSLDVEFKHWKKLTTDQPELRRHHSQVRRLDATIAGLLEPLTQQLSGPGTSSDDILLKGQDWENEILAAHSIWEVFRAKLLLREDPVFREHLAACDDFAWACYQPAQTHFAKQRREPPLVYFSATWSPFALSRDANFQNEIRAGSGTAGWLAEDDFQAVLARLPIPLLSIPWYQVAHLPAALILAHEVGHLVAADFGLEATIRELLDRANLDHVDLWKQWWSEVFADLYGCVTVGPAFLGALMDLLASSAALVQQEDKRSGSYPSRALRVELGLGALEQMGRSADAVRLRTDWEKLYGPIQKMTELLPEVPKVITALLAGPYEGLALNQIITFDFADYSIPGKLARAGSPLNASQRDPRLLFAAARWLHENEPSAPALQKACDLLRQHLVLSAPKEFRFRGEPKPDPGQFEALLSAQEKEDRAAGLDLRAQLFPATAPGP